MAPQRTSSSSRLHRIVGGLTIGALAFSACARGDSAPQVPTFLAAAGELTTASSARGNLEAASSYRLRAPAIGEIAELYVVNGQRVQAGDVLAVIDSPQVDAQLLQAEMLLAQTEAQEYMNEVSELQAQSVLRQQELTADFIDELQASLDEFEATIEAAEAAEDAAEYAADASDDVQVETSSDSIEVAPTGTSKAGPGPLPTPIPGPGPGLPGPPTPPTTTPPTTTPPTTTPPTPPTLPTLPGPGSIGGAIDRALAELEASIEAALQPLTDQIAALEDAVVDGTEEITDGIVEATDAILDATDTINTTIVDATDTLHGELENLGDELQDIEDAVLQVAEDVEQELQDAQDQAEEKGDIIADEYQEYNDELIAVSEATLDQMSALLDAASASLRDVAERQLALAQEAAQDLVITAPADGIVVFGEEAGSAAALGAAGAGTPAGVPTAAGLLGGGATTGAGGGDLIQLGSSVTAGVPVFELHQPDRLQITTTFDEFDVIDIFEGQDAIVRVASTGADLPGEVEWISPVGTPSGTSVVYDVVISIDATARDAANLRIGMSTEIEIIESTVDAGILIRDAALNRDGDRTFVFVHEDGRVREIDVDVLATDGVTASVTGIDDGVEVVIAVDDLADGDEVQAAR